MAPQATGKASQFPAPGAGLHVCKYNSQQGNKQTTPFERPPAALAFTAVVLFEPSALKPLNPSV
jgi:hypothetical protein